MSVEPNRTMERQALDKSAIFTMNLTVLLLSGCMCAGGVQYTCPGLTPVHAPGLKFIKSSPTSCVFQLHRATAATSLCVSARFSSSTNRTPPGSTRSEAPAALRPTYSGPSTVLHVLAVVLVKYAPFQYERAALPPSCITAHTCDDAVCCATVTPISASASTQPLKRRLVADTNCARHWLEPPICVSVRSALSPPLESLNPTMDVYACDPVMPVLLAVAMRGFMTQPSPLTLAVPVRGPREPARGDQAQMPLQAVRSRAS